MPKIEKYIPYRTQAGDTFDSLALSMYNEEKKASYIIDYNPDYADVLIFEAGIDLKLPVVTNLSNEITLPPWRRSEES